MRFIAFSTDDQPGRPLVFRCFTVLRQPWERRRRSWLLLTSEKARLALGEEVADDGVVSGTPGLTTTTNLTVGTKENQWLCQRSRIARCDRVLNTRSDPVQELAEKNGLNLPTSLSNSL